MSITIIKHADFQKNYNYIVTTGAGNYNLPRRDVDALYSPGWPVAPVTRPEDSDLPRKFDYPVGVNYTLQPRVGYEGLFPVKALKSAYDSVSEVSMPINMIIRELSAFTPILRRKKDKQRADEGHPYNWMTVSPDRKVPFNVWLSWFKKSSKIYAAPAFVKMRDHGKVTAMRYIDGSTLFLIINDDGDLPEPQDVDPELRQFIEQARDGKLTSTAQIRNAMAGGWSPGPINANTSIFSGSPMTKGALLGKQEVLGKIVDRYNPFKVAEYLKQAQDYVNRTGNPIPTTPAYTQIIKGVPFSFWDKDQVYYIPEPPAPSIDTPYGESFIERAFAWIQVIAVITGFELGHYRTGNMPEGLLAVSKDLFPTMGKLATGEREWNARMAESSQTWHSRIRWVPQDTKWYPTKKPDFPKDLYEQAFINILYNIGMPPSEFGIRPGRGGAGSGSSGMGGKGYEQGAAHDVTRQILENEKRSTEDAFNRVLLDDDVDDVEWALDYPDEEIDPSMQSQNLWNEFIHGIKTLNDIRSEMGEDSIGDPDDKENYANLHLIIAGNSIYVVEKLSLDQTGMAIPSNAKPNQAGGDPVGPEDGLLDGKDHEPGDQNKAKQVAKEIEASGGKKTNSIKIFIPQGQPMAKKNGNGKKAENNPVVELETETGSIQVINHDPEVEIPELEGLPLSKYNENHDELGRFAPDDGGVQGGGKENEVDNKRIGAKLSENQVVNRLVNGQKIAYKPGRGNKYVPVNVTRNEDNTYTLRVGSNETVHSSAVSLWGMALDKENIGRYYLYKSIDDVDPEEFRVGMKEEQEHAATVGNDQSMIRQIVLDHLREDPQYYTHLREAGMAKLSQMLKADIKHDGDGAMVAVFIPQGVANKLRKIADGLGLPADAQQEMADNMHVTLAYLPDDKASQESADTIMSCVQTVAAKYGKLEGNIQGFGVFNGKDGIKVLYATLDNPDLPFIRSEICEHLEAAGIKVAMDHGFVPHITLSYFPEDWRLPEGFALPDIPVKIDGLSFARGPKVKTVTFSGKAVHKYLKVDWPEYFKHCGVCPEDKAYFDAPISREFQIPLPLAANDDGEEKHHANTVEIVAMSPEGMEPQPALWKPAGGELDSLNEAIGGQQYKREEAAWLLDQCLDFHMVPLAYTTQSNNEDGAAIWYTAGGKATNPQPVEDYAPEWIERAAVLDCIMAQQDRGAKHNYLTHPDDPKRIILIDNGYSFPVDPKKYYHSLFCDAVSGKKLSDSTMMAIKMCVGDAACWQDIKDLIGAKASANAIARAKKMLEIGMIISDDDGDGSAGGQTTTEPPTDPSNTSPTDSPETTTETDTEPVDTTPTETDTEPSTLEKSNDSDPEKVDDSLDFKKRYKVYKQGKKWVVKNIDTGKVVPGGRHDTEEEANGHARALWANVPDASE